MAKKIIVHVSEVNISQESGMGRVEYYWKNAFENAGFEFIHIGPAEIGNVKLPFFFAREAYKYYKKLRINASAFVIHEPLAGFFSYGKVPCFLESHGVERRYWEDRISGKIPSKNAKISLKSKLFFPMWRLFGCDRGLRKSSKLLLINTEDIDYVKTAYHRLDEDIFLFKNGISELTKMCTRIKPKTFTVLFNGNWIERKGTQTLVDAAKILFYKNLNINYLLIGTGIDEAFVLKDWPEYLHPFVKTIKRFNVSEENGYLEKASIFVLPSYAEGQPLSLLQAMAAGRCCITTNCCGQKDIISDGETGLLFDAGNARSFAGLIMNCYKDAALTKKIGDNAKAYIKTYTWSHVAAQVVDFVNEMITEKP